MKRFQMMMMMKKGANSKETKDLSFENMVVCLEQVLPVAWITIIFSCTWMNPDKVGLAGHYTSCPAHCPRSLPPFFPFLPPLSLFSPLFPSPPPFSPAAPGRPCTRLSIHDYCHLRFNQSSDARTRASWRYLHFNSIPWWFVCRTAFKPHVHYDESFSRTQCGTSLAQKTAVK